VIVRCTAKLLNLLGKHSVALVDAPATSDDWYANLLWVDRRKCLLIVHADTLFALFAADVRVGDLRPFSAVSSICSPLSCSRRAYRPTRSAALSQTTFGSPRRRANRCSAS
jgi:hypothetical protein